MSLCQKHVVYGVYVVRDGNGGKAAVREKVTNLERTFSFSFWIFFLCWTPPFEYLLLSIHFKIVAKFYDYFFMNVLWSYLPIMPLRSKVNLKKDAHTFPLLPWLDFEWKFFRMTNVRCYMRQISSFKKFILCGCERQIFCSRFFH